MLRRLRTWNEGREPAQVVEITVGVSTGEALASGAPGADLRVTSDAIAAAARLRQVAAPGAIVVGERTARAVRAHFEPREVGEGGAWLVDAGEPTGTPEPATPLVGRDHELDLLESTLDHVRLEGRAALVTIVGDAGVGKSRLVRELLAGLDGEP